MLVPETLNMFNGCIANFEPLFFPSYLSFSTLSVLIRLTLPFRALSAVVLLCANANAVEM
jgi:hypothetical protein